VSQSGVSGAKTFTRAGLGVTSALLSDGQADYTPGISERRAGVSTWQHAGSKSVGRQLTAGGSVTASRNYSSWGELKSSWGAWKGPFGYGGSVGYQSDPNGLQLLGHRYYDPVAGRFLSPDPIQDGGNWYAYAGNSPVSFVDPWGLVRVTVFWREAVAGQMHMYLLIEDYVYGVKQSDKKFYVSAGPQGKSWFGPYGKLWRKGQTYERGHKPEYKLIILDDDTPFSHARHAFNQASLMAHNVVDYKAVGGPNSNAYVMRVLHLLGLEGHFWQAYNAEPWLKRAPLNWSPGWDYYQDEDGWGKPKPLWLPQWGHRTT